MASTSVDMPNAGFGKSTKVDAAQYLLWLIILSVRVFIMISHTH